MELLTTQELDREAQQTSDQVVGSQETERQGRTLIMGLSRRGYKEGQLVYIAITTINM